MSQLHRVLIMAGGTGGHVFPGLALAARLRDKNIEVAWLGTEKGMEGALVRQANIPFHFIHIQGVRGKGMASLLMAPFRIFKACLEARRIIKTLQPDVVVGMGGFVAGPGGIMSVLSGKPLLIHEQNAKAGTTNKILAKFATRVLMGFPDAFPPSSKTVYVGNPVRAEIAALPAPSVRFKDRSGRLKLLVIGGSLGAAALNDLLPKAIALLPPESRPEIQHQAGKKHLESCLKSYKDNHIEAIVQPFIEDMASAYSSADLVICRAGALTVAELCAAGVGAILVPYPHAVDDHQTLNADFMVKGKAAIIIQQSALTAEILAKHIAVFAENRDTALAYAEHAYALRNIRSTELIYDICEESCL